MVMLHYLDLIIKLYSMRILLILIVFSLVGCENNTSTTYIIPKESDSSLKDSFAINSSETLTKDNEINNSNNISYLVPNTWNEFEPSSLRKANFKIDKNYRQAEVSITVFPGDVGGNLANVNRWRKQLNLSSINLIELKKSLKSTNISNHNGYYIEIVAEEKSTTAAFVKINNLTWFFKMTGEKSLVNSEKENFLFFLDNFDIR